MHFLIDLDSAIFKAGCANETSCYMVYNHNGIPVADFQYKKDADKFAEEASFDAVVEKVKEAGPLHHSIANLRNIVDGILRHPRLTSYEIFIGGKGNFRYDIYPEYKSNRKAEDRPIHEDKLRQYLVKFYKAKLVNGQEADDEVSILSTGRTDVVIASIDKDLNNTPGWHYNYDTKELYFVTDDDANLNFYRQLLMGDSTDGITGIKGVGKIAAESILPEALTPEEMCAIVWDEYASRGYTYEYFVLQGRLLWMRRERNEMWEPPMTVPEGLSVSPAEEQPTQQSTDVQSVEEE